MIQDVLKQAKPNKRIHARFSQNILIEDYEGFSTRAISVSVRRNVPRSVEDTTTSICGSTGCCCVEEDSNDDGLASPLLFHSSTRDDITACSALLRNSAPPISSLF